MLLVWNWILGPKSKSLFISIEMYVLSLFILAKWPIKHSTPTEAFFFTSTSYAWSNFIFFFFPSFFFLSWNSIRPQSLQLLCLYHPFFCVVLSTKNCATLKWAHEYIRMYVRWTLFVSFVQNVLFVCHSVYSVNMEMNGNVCSRVFVCVLFFSFRMQFNVYGVQLMCDMYCCRNRSK